MNYRVEYTKNDSHGNPIVTRHIVQQSVGAEWQLKDGNHRNIRPFDNLADAMNWIDEERRGV